MTQGRTYGADPAGDASHVIHERRRLELHSAETGLGFLRCSKEASAESKSESGENDGSHGPFLMVSEGADDNGMSMPLFLKLE